jgi:3-methyladenine DNA glycosylase AlkD
VDVAVLVDEIDAGLRAAATPERAAKEQAYLKSALTHYGTSVPATRAVTRAALSAFPEPTHAEVVALVEQLWAAPVHERRVAGEVVLVRWSAHLEAGDIDLVERLVRQSRTWALVDGLAGDVVGPLVERYPELGAVLDRWATDDDFWIRRSALLALLVPLRRGGGDFDRFSRYADAMLDEREFFIRKAIGWVLRDTARLRPDLVYQWLLPRAGRCSGVTLREAVKRLTAEQRQAVLDAR